MTTDEETRSWREHPGAAELAVHRLPAYLMSQRWYPAKDAGLPQVSLDRLAEFGAGGKVAMTLWKVSPPNQAAIPIFIPLEYLGDRPREGGSAGIGALPEGGFLRDAVESDEFVRSLVAFMLDAGPGTAPLRAGRARDVPRRDPGGWTIDRPRAEQSNTSLRIGDWGILKILRRPVEGVHPEVEMGRFLAEQTTFRAVAAPLAWLEWDGTTLAILQAFVPNEGDGWSWVLERLRAGDLRDTRLMQWLERLGRRTAEMHRALATPTDDEAFATEPVTQSDWERYVDEMAGRAARIEAALDEAPSPGGDRARDSIQRFKAHVAPMRHLLRSLIPRHGHILKTRHHGDFHLGQVLVQEHDAIIVDFEGEPLRSLQERRAKQVALRDVAGMLRSLSYVAAVAARERSAGVPEARREAEHERLRGWSEDAGAAFLRGYHAARTELDGGDAEDESRAVRLFTVEKALYEISYELANRPDWLHIPLEGLLSILDRLEAGTDRRQSQVLTRRHAMRHGAEILPGGGVRFALWAPKLQSVSLRIGGESATARTVSMDSRGEGWHEAIVPEAGAGTRYQFLMPDGLAVPDPASRFQPDDVHGASEVIDPASFSWRDGDWQSRPWLEAVIYELHVGTFTPEGTFRAAIGRLDHLARLGVTAIELMPLADFPGSRNWGYDGVLPYAPDSSYGRPDDLKALVEAAHARGIMVLLDVVYNHFGPDGNYLPVYAPGFFTDRHQTPWGAAVNYDGANASPVREFIIHNALYWIEEYNFDGLRLDAVHAIRDEGSTHLLRELAERVRAVRDRPVHLLLENEENEAHWLTRDASGVAPLYSAQWNDDAHHVLHTAATGEGQGYYSDYLGDTHKLARALAEGFAFQGETMAFRGTARGEPSAQLPPWAFVAFIQNHDQIGNRAYGERLSMLASPAAQLALSAVYLLLPQIPMLFMGEEWGTRQPFPFFCDFSGALAEAVRQGRRQEFAKFPEFQDEASRARIPDPQSPDTFASAKLDWESLTQPAAAAWLERYRRLLETRAAIILPLMKRMPGRAGTAEVVGKGAVVIRWSVAPGGPGQPGGSLTLEANLSDISASGFSAPAGRTIWEEGTQSMTTLEPWSVRWSLQPETAR